MNNLMHLLSFSHCSIPNCLLFSHFVSKQIFSFPPALLQIFFEDSVTVGWNIYWNSCSLFLFATLNMKAFLPSFGLFSVGSTSAFHVSTVHISQKPQSNSLYPYLTNLPFVTLSFFLQQNLVFWLLPNTLFRNIFPSLILQSPNQKPASHYVLS